MFIKDGDPEFDKERTGTGTAEWSEISENICRGCANDCLYCYAAANSDRRKQKERSQWHVEEYNKKALRTSYPAKKGVIMFPTTHDITPFNVDEYIRVAILMLEKGNNLLIVSKPRMSCICKMTKAFDKYKNQILFRFTIGAVQEEISKFWEPNAPLPAERVACLSFVKSIGFSTSVSIEPMLAGAAETIAVVDFVEPCVTDTIWIGKMNMLRSRVDMTKPENAEAVYKIEKQQTDDKIMKLVTYFKDTPMIRWKDSIKKVIKSSGSS